MGAKIFAWVGGFALFLGVIFFVKLSIERGWISPELRTALGFVTGAGLVVGGVVMHRRPRYTTLAQTLCATGSVMLYGVTFAAHSIWRIPPFDQPGASFAMMSLITGVAFLLARTPAALQRRPGMTKAAPCRGGFDLSRKWPCLLDLQGRHFDAFRHPQRDRIGLHQPPTQPVKTFASHQARHAHVVSRCANRLINRAFQAKTTGSNQKKRHQERPAL